MQLCIASTVHLPTCSTISESPPPPHDKPLNLVFQKNFLCSRHFFWNFCNSPGLVFINGPRYVRLQAGLYLCIKIVREDPLSIRAFIDICCTHTLNSTVLYCTVVNYMLINTNTGGSVRCVWGKEGYRGGVEVSHLHRQYVHYRVGRFIKFNQIEKVYVRFMPN